MRVKVSSVVWLMVAVTLLMGCGGGNSVDQPVETSVSMTDPVTKELVVYTPEGGKFVFSGLEMLMKAHGLMYDVRIMEGVTTDLIVEGLKDGAFDLVFMHRQPRPGEGVEFFEIQRVNVAVFTHQDTGVDNLTTDQIAAIFSGEITNWSEIGGRDQGIAVFVLPESDSTTEALRAIALGEKPFVESAQLLPSETSVMLSATGVPGGVGYATWATKKYLELSDPNGSIQAFHAISIDGVAVNDPDYQMSIVIGFGYLPEQTETLKPLFDWLTEFLNSPQGQHLLQLFDVSTTIKHQPKK